MYSNGYSLGFLISVYLSGCTLGFKLYLYDFRDDLFDNQLMSSSLGKTIFPPPALRIPKLIVFLLLGLIPPELSPFMLAWLLMLSLFSSCLTFMWNFMGVIFDTTTKQQTPWSSYNLPFHSVIWELVAQVFCRHSHQDLVTHLSFLLVIVLF